jgi:hypothetical protein
MLFRLFSQLRCPWERPVAKWPYALHSLPEYFDRCHRPVESQSLFAIARLEWLLRAALACNRIVNLGDRCLSGQSVLLFLEDATWALMQPVVGTQYCSFQNYLA